MARRSESLIAQIERDALDEQASLAGALRKCVVLGGQSGSEQLRDWATRELNGYYGEDVPLPSYRVIPAPLMIDGVNANVHITGQQIAPSSLPGFAREHLREEVELRDGVGALEALARHGETGERIKLSPPMAADLARLMNHESGNPLQQILSIYWSVAPAALRGVLDQVRTALTQLVAELQANMPRDQEVPSEDAANQAVNVIVTGKRSQVRVNTAQASGQESTASARGDSSDAERESGFWTRARLIGAGVVGVATIVGTVVAVIQLH